MTSIVKSRNKRTGITYVYESESFWVPGKGPRNRRRLIGKIDPETGEVVPTDGRRRKAAERRAREEAEAAEAAEAAATGANAPERPAPSPDGRVAEDDGGRDACVEALRRADEALASIEAEVGRLRGEISEALAEAGGGVR